MMMIMMIMMFWPHTAVTQTSDTNYFHYLNWQISILLSVLCLHTGSLVVFAGRQEG
jgi:hypothetical protein